MRRNTVRASRLGGIPTSQIDRGAALAGRTRVDYWCHADHKTTAAFESTADVPSLWDCRTCGAPAQLERGSAPEIARPRWFPKTPYEFLMMRRSEEEGEELLAEALEDVRRRRATGQLH